MDIVSRAEWGARPWQGTPVKVAMKERTEFFTHWFGTPPRADRGPELMREIERIHMDSNAWMGVGYNFVVDQAGRVFEGRGWGVQGAHCPGYNRSGFGVLLAVGKGGPSASEAALRSARALYEEACRRTGRTLAQRGHRDGTSTECPGAELYAWVRAGMPAPAALSGTYTVRSGDTLWSIAQAHGTTVDALRAASGISGDLIRPGDRLTIPGPATPPTPSPAAPAKPPARPRVSLRRLVEAARKDPPASGSQVTYGDGVLVVERALAVEGLLARKYVDRHFGTKTVAAYSRWQQRLGYRGTQPGGAADGIPGRASLRRLGDKYDFDVED